MPGLPLTANVVPRSTWYDWHSLYSFPCELWGHPSDRPEVRLSYHRAVLLRHIGSYTAKLIQITGIVQTSRVLVVGAAFGWTAEILRDQHGLAADRVATVDPSAYIGLARGETEEADINGVIAGVGMDLADGYSKWLKGQFFDGGARCRTPFSASRLENQSAANAVKSMFPSSAVDVVLTDDGYLNYHDDAQIAEIFAAVDRVGAAKVWHVTYSDWEMGNSKTVDQFKSLKPTHEFVDFNTLTRLD